MQQKTTTWSTWEELLLAFSVKRHGLKDWNSVAMELRNRSSSLPALLTAQICREKFIDLHRRFTNENAFSGEHDGGGAVVIPWLEDLRQVRVAELKQELQRHDLSIQSLQTKVKMMEEEREKGTAMKPDLDSEGKKVNSPEEIGRKIVSGDENRSFNESNSMEKSKPGPVHRTGPDAKLDRQTDSCRDSSNRHETSKASQENNKGDDDVCKDERKEGSDVESSANLTKKRRRKRGVAAAVAVCGGEKAAEVSPAIAIKSEPLIRVLDIIRSHKHGSMFKRRLQIQKTNKYKSMIKRHVDLDMVQTRIENGSYSSCPNKFYSDLLLLFTNAVVFFPKSSLEFTAAQELRKLVINELQTTRKPETPEPLLAKCNSTVGPIVVCRRRSSVSAKVVSFSDEDYGSEKAKAVKERPVTGVRSMRRTSKGRMCNNNNSNNNNSNSNSNNNNKAEEAAAVVKKVEKKKELSAEKKRGAADFLKRIKKGSPTKESPSPTPSDNSSGGRKQLKRKATEKKDVPPLPPPPVKQNGKKKAKVESSPAKKSMGRPRRTTKETPGKDDSSKRPKKRTKR